MRPSARWPRANEHSHSSKEKVSRLGYPDARAESQAPSGDVARLAMPRQTSIQESEPCRSTNTGSRCLSTSPGCRGGGDWLDAELLHRESANQHENRHDDQLSDQKRWFLLRRSQ